MALPPFSAQAESFFQETVAKDLSELWPVKEVWESRVGALEQLLRQETERTESRSSNASIRLGWKLRDYGRGHIMVVPVEQKRTKTGGWTKGREVALYRLTDLQDEKLDYLTEQDKAVLAAVQRKRRYYDMIYQLDPGRGPAGPGGAPQRLLGRPPRPAGRDRARHARGPHRAPRAADCASPWTPIPARS